MITPLSELDRGEEGRVLRGLLGMMIKRRTADADLLEIRVDRCDEFLRQYTVGVTLDAVSGVYMIVVNPKEHIIHVAT